MHATNSLRLGASLRLSRPLQDQTLHAAHGRAARVVQRVREAACERHEALEARQLARRLGAPLDEDALEASHQRAAGRERQPTMRAARSRARSRARSGALGVRCGAAEDGLGLEHLRSRLGLGLGLG